MKLNYNLRYSWSYYRTVTEFVLQFGSWTSTDPPVKILDPLAQHHWSLNTLYPFNMLTFFR